ncbi:MAG: hypothetical protein ACON5H_12065 [Akkermansiaceae bacterium]
MAQSELSESPTIDIQKRQFESAYEAFRAGKEEGSVKAREEAPHVKGVLAEVIHDFAYSLAYGSNFAGAFANEFVPKNIREVMAKGAAARRAAGVKAREKAAAAIRPEESPEKHVVEAVVVNS